MPIKIISKKFVNLKLIKIFDKLQVDKNFLSSAMNGIVFYVLIILNLLLFESYKI